MNKRPLLLVTTELPDVGRSGGIGAAIYELASAMRDTHPVDILYVNTQGLDDARFEEARATYRRSGIRLRWFDPKEYSKPETGYLRHYAWGVYRFLSEQQTNYSHIHFHDYLGIGFYCISARRQGLAFTETQLVVQLHGPLRWAMEMNDSPFFHEDHLIQDYMEMHSVAWCDQVAAPSEYIWNWYQAYLPEHRNEKQGHHILPNLFRRAAYESGASLAKRRSESAENGLQELIIFGRHEHRKSIHTAVKAITAIEGELAHRRVRVTFIGQPGMIHNGDSFSYFVKATQNWRCDFQFFMHFDRHDALNYLAERHNHALAIIPSRIENAPYTVLETISANIPCLFSSEGGAKELVAEEDVASVTCEMNAVSLSEAILSRLDKGAKAARPRRSHDEAETLWRNFHKPSKKKKDTGSKRSKLEQPLVSVCITHYERPAKLVDCVFAFLRQSYPKIELILVDDGSRSEDAVRQLAHVEKLLQKQGGTVIRQDNAYLGAARNTAFKQAKGDYVLFFDDDDLPDPHLVETLVKAILHTGADVMTCQNVYMPEETRGEVLANPSSQNGLPSHLCLGGPLSLAAELNLFGSCVALIAASCFRKIGGYSEKYGVGHEDFELYIRMAQHGYRIESCPAVLFHYECQKSSMVTETHTIANYRRSAEAFCDSTHPAMKDYIMLNAGRYMTETAKQRMEWHCYNDKHTELRLSLRDQSLSLENRLRTAATYSKLTGNRRADAAFRRALHACRHGVGDITVNEQPELISPWDAIRKPEAPHLQNAVLTFEQLEMLELIGLQREQECAPFLEQSVLDAEQLDASLHALLQSACDHLSHLPLSEKACTHLCQLKTTLSPIEAMEIMTLTCTLAEKTALAQRCFNAICKLEEQDYLKQYQDIATAVETGALRSGWHHFSSYAQAEDRNGFRVTSRLKAFILDKKPELADTICIGMIRDLQKTTKNRGVHLVSQDQQYG